MHGFAGLFQLSEISDEARLRTGNFIDASFFLTLMNTSKKSLAIGATIPNTHIQQLNNYCNRFKLVAPIIISSFNSLNKIIKFRSAYRKPNQTCVCLVRFSEKKNGFQFRKKFRQMMMVLFIKVLASNPFDSRFSVFQLKYSTTSNQLYLNINNLINFVAR